MTEEEIEKMREVIMSAVLAMTREEKIMLLDFLDHLKRGVENEQ